MFTRYVVGYLFLTAIIVVTLALQYNQEQEFRYQIRFTDNRNQCVDDRKWNDTAVAVKALFEKINKDKYPNDPELQKLNTFQKYVIAVMRTPTHPLPCPQIPLGPGSRQ